MNKLPAAIANLASQKEPLTQLLITWAEQNSGSGNTEGLAKMLELLCASFSRIPGAKVEKVGLAGSPAKALLVTQRPEAPIQFLCSGHYDTVYGPEHPFQRCTNQEGGRLGGPGVADMKGGLVVMLAALGAFEQLESSKKVGWKVLITPDEEIGSTASGPLISTTATKSTLGFVFEPARGNGDLVKSRSGTAVFTVTCHGKAAHAARVPNEGKNAILALAEFVLGAQQIAELAPGILVNTGNIRGGGPVNIVPDFAEAQINIRIQTASSQRLVEEKLASLAKTISEHAGVRFEMQGAFDRPPKECGKVEETLFQAWCEAAQQIGTKPFSWQHSGGGSDGNLLSAVGLPNLDGLGIIGDHLHSDREYAEPDSLVTRAQIAALVFDRIAKGEIRIQ